MICPVDESRLGIGRPPLRELSENVCPQVIDLRGGEINAETIGCAVFAQRMYKPMHAKEEK